MLSKVIYMGKNYAQFLSVELYFSYSMLATHKVTENRNIVN